MNAQLFLTSVPLRRFLTASQPQTTRTSAPADSREGHTHALENEASTARGYTRVRNTHQIFTGDNTY